MEETYIVFVLREIQSSIRKQRPAIKEHMKQFLRGVRTRQYRMFARQISIARILMGSECTLDAALYARMTGDLLRPSTPITESPHVKLLRAYCDIGDAILEPEAFGRTEYCKNAMMAIDITGDYFGLRTEVDVRAFACNFLRRFRGLPEKELMMEKQSPDQRPILLRRIRYSDCLEVVDGNHRLAMSVVRGETSVRAYVLRKPSLTPLQTALLETLWTGGQRLLYQPIDAPELKQGWALVRRCTDRFELLSQWLDKEGPALGSLNTSMDLGSYYGWFIQAFQNKGLQAYGVERDPIAASLGPIVYGLRSDQVIRSDLVRFLQSTDATYDITSCFSVLHHFVLGRGSVPAEELIRLIDRITGKVLFFDTGQGHEEWFKDSLAEWNPDYIEAWLRRHTTFRRVVRLGTDQDAVHPFERNYGRTLFACVRD